MIVVNLNYKQGVQPSTSRIAHNATMNAIWQHRYAGWDAKNPQGTTALDGEIGETIPDQIGGEPINRTGAEPPLLGKTRMLYQEGIIEDVLPIGFFKNQTNTQMASEGKPVPDKNRVFGFVWLDVDYRIFESYNNNFNRPYIGELKARNSSSTPIGMTTVRTTNSEEYTVEAPIVPNAINCFIMQLVDDGLASESGRTSLKLWHNGVLLNPSKHLETFYRAIAAQGYGADTNCEMMGVIESFDYYGTMTNAQINDTFAALNSYYGTLGVVPNLPYNTDVYATRAGNQITAHYTFVPNSSGALENVSKRKIVWETGPSLQTMVQKTEVDNLLTFDRSLYGDWSGPIRLNIYSEDVNGKKFVTPGVWFGNI